MMFTLKKTYLLGLGSWLNDQPLSGRASRARTRFVEMLQEELNRFNDDRLALLKQLADKDEKGEPKIDTETKQFVLSDDARQQYASEYGLLINEDWKADITEANRDMFDSIKAIVIDTDYKFGPHDGEPADVSQQRILMMNEYPHWCDAFDLI